MRIAEAGTGATPSLQYIDHKLHDTDKHQGKSIQSPIEKSGSVNKPRLVTEGEKNIRFFPKRSAVAGCVRALYMRVCACCRSGGQILQKGKNQGLAWYNQMQVLRPCLFAKRKTPLSAFRSRSGRRQ